ncbi:M48 family metallopeptidase [Ideonella sp.]|uniref:M48 family metallopeptidase n=1 Tax=Ideonella sp. TaxID=1929293 RepID=UPI002B474A6E|nr:M48 family metallopeptidase [Ideonella sp.]HJV71355.1 M48 family metallopeptidase [Ideonella sp.]
MELPEFERMVARLENKSRQSPAVYQANVALLALLGFAILASIIGMAGVGMLILVAVPFALWWGGLHSIGLLAGLGKLLLLLALPLWLLVKSAVSALLTRFPTPQGLELHRQQAPALFEAIDDMRRRMKGPRFHHVLISEELNAAVVQRPLLGLFGPPRNYLILGLPLLDCLSPQEALAVVAHEYGHLAGSHSHFAAFIYRLRIAWGTVHLISQQWTGAVGRLLQGLIGWYAPYFNAYSFVLARANEYQADAAAAELVGPEVTASALKRVDVSGAHYGQFVQRTFRQASAVAAPPEDFATRWATVAQEVPAGEAQRWLQRALEAQGGVGDTHPPLRERLRALQGETAPGVAQVPAPIEGVCAADAWLGQSALAVRLAIQAQWRERVAEPWRSQYEQTQKQRQRLEELSAIAGPTEDEHAERLRLRLACEATADFADDVAAFGAAHPRNALGPYLEGTWRLSNDDDGGLDGLERAMALDADAIKPACERAYAFLQERNDPRAERYQQRWKERDQWEQTVAPQLRKIDVSHELQSPDLTAEQAATIAALVRAHRAGIARAFLARRVLPVDSSVATYVLALELQPAPPRLETSDEIVTRLAGSGVWPVHVVVCALEGKNQVLQPRLHRLAHSEIDLTLAL